MAPGLGAAFSRILTQAAQRCLRRGIRQGLRPPTRSRGARPARTATASGDRFPGGEYPGDFPGTPEMTYAPHPDGLADPGEIVWTWVPYEENHQQGKDRPVLVIGRDGRWLLALQLTSKDHDRDQAQERRAGRLWQDIGSGPWDHDGRPSEVRLNRIIRVAPDAVRREGSTLSRERFTQVVDGVRAAS